MSELAKKNSQTKSARKSEIRSHYLRLRSNIAPSDFESWQRALNANLQELLNRLHGGGIWAGYRALSTEANPATAIASLRDRTWAYPAICGGGNLRFLVPGPTPTWIKNAVQIEEPSRAHATEVTLAGLGGVLLPGVAFDGQGSRLGFGKGYYDRALAHFTGIKVGVAFSIQVDPDLLPCESHDVMLDWIVTDQEILGPLENARPMMNER